VRGIQARFCLLSVLWLKLRWLIYRVAWVLRVANSSGEEGRNASLSHLYARRLCPNIFQEGMPSLLMARLA